MGTTNTSGMHRAKLWQIGGFAFNNTATNLYMFMMETFCESEALPGFAY